MAADVKHIKVQIDISTAKANAELNKLANKLEKISALAGSLDVAEKVTLMTDAFGELGVVLAALNGVGDIVTRFSEFKNSLDEVKKGLESLFGKETVEIVTSSVKSLFSPLAAHIGEFISYVSIGAGTVGESFSVAFGSRDRKSVV